MNLTKGDIDRLGNIIREQGSSIDDEILVELQNYRTSHKEALSSTFTTLCSCSKKVSPSTIVTFRIKRFQSIIGKLNRYPEMRFSRMWDIGGCRCIVDNEKGVYKLKDIIANDPGLEIVKEYDYIKDPQKDGYKSLHLFVRHKPFDNIIEVQLRSIENHNWATLVEISDLLFDSKLKEYGEDKKLFEFHKLLSNPVNLTIEDKYRISQIIKEYRYFEKLSEVFSRNYLKVRKQWAEKETQGNHRFFLIEANKNDTPKIESFSRFQEAEEEYFNIYKKGQNANVVLTHLQNTNYKQISIAYSNYILTFHSFLFECLEILESLIVDTLKTKRHIAFYKVCNLYSGLLFTHISNLVSELTEIQNSSIAKGNSKKFKKKEKEWLGDIRDQIRKLNQGGKRFEVSIRQNIKSGGFFTKNINSLIVRFVARTYRKKSQKVLENSKILSTHK